MELVVVVRVIGRDQGRLRDTTQLVREGDVKVVREYQSEVRNDKKANHRIADDHPRKQSHHLAAEDSLAPKI